MEVLNINKDNFKEIVLEYKGKILVDFNADWCGPCQMLKPIVEELANERNDIKVAAVNVDTEEELATRYGVMTIPCLVLFEDGKETDRMIGFKTKEEVEKFIGE